MIPFFPFGYDKSKNKSTEIVGAKGTNSKSQGLGTETGLVNWGTTRTFQEQSEVDRSIQYNPNFSDQRTSQLYYSPQLALGSPNAKQSPITGFSSKPSFSPKFNQDKAFGDDAAKAEGSKTDMSGILIIAGLAVGGYILVKSPKARKKLKGDKK